MIWGDIRRGGQLIPETIKHTHIHIDRILRIRKLTSVITLHCVRMDIRWEGVLKENRS